MAEPTLTYEFKSLLNKIKNEIILQYPIQMITVNYLVYAILDTDTHDVTSWMNQNMTSSTINEFKSIVIDKINSDMAASVMVHQESVRFVKEYDNMAIELSNGGANLVGSSAMFIKIISEDDNYRKFFRRNGYTEQILSDAIISKHIDNANGNKIEEKPSKRKKKNTPVTKNPHNTENDTNGGTYRVIPEENNIIEQKGVNMVRMASNNKYGTYIKIDSTILKIFDTLAKCDKNNVIIVGKKGCGKTALLERMAQLIYKQECPIGFRDKYLMRFDYQMSTILIDEMSNSGKYIACIDDIEKLFLQKDNDGQSMEVLKQLLVAKDVPVVLTISDTLYSKYIVDKADITRHIQKVVIPDWSDTDMFDIVKVSSAKYLDYHSCTMSDDIISTCIRMAKTHIKDDHCPSSALNIIDSVCAYARLHQEMPESLKNGKEHLNELLTTIALISNTSDAESYETKDKLLRDAINLRQKIQKMEEDFESAKIDIDEETVYETMSSILNLPLSKLNVSEKERLKTLMPNLQKVVIGQDEAIDAVCKAVKRQRVGFNKSDKPCVMMFVGSTGTGKTFLAKRLAYEIFGDEKNMVRLDMSEYSDKTSVTKLYGSAPGYVGYDNGGILTEAIKQNNRCVLLLDEIEKADDEIFNVFLQVFDDGRLTDNKGNVVDFKNVIIIMTSNAGSKDVSENKAIGFGNRNTMQEDKKIILKSMKRMFKPEFINRIDNICFFNKLTEENIRTIIKNEVEKVHENVKRMGYELDESITDGQLIESIFEKVKEESEYGARPILREIQSQLEDKLTDYIIDNDVEKGFVFTHETIYKENL